MDADTPTDPTAPKVMASRGHTAAASAPQRAAGSRLQHLFRASRQAGQVHPLWAPMQSRGTQPYDAGAGPALPPTVRHGPGERLLPDQVRRRVAELPPLPKAAMRALQTLRREQASLEEVAADLACDSSLMVRILKLANSPFYGVAGRVSSARDAAQILGRRTLESMLTLAAVAGQIQGPQSQTFDATVYWRHALASAIAARGLARAAGIDEDQAFVAALLHDVGLLAMSAYFPQALDALALQARADDTELCAVERRQGLTSHADVGAWIAAHWRFPDPVVQAIAAHHAPTAVLPEVGPLAACVHVADALAHALDLAGLAHEFVPTIDPVAWQRVGLTEAALQSLIDETETGVRSLYAALSA